MPAFNISELKPGDPLIISSTDYANSPVRRHHDSDRRRPDSHVRPRSAGRINVGTWSVDMNMPQ